MTAPHRPPKGSRTTEEILLLKLPLRVSKFPDLIPQFTHVNRGIHACIYLVIVQPPPNAVGCSGLASRLAGSLEVLHRALVLLRLLTGLEGAKISTLADLGILLARRKRRLYFE
jgi:hypothetical protein